MHEKDLIGQIVRREEGGMDALLTYSGPLMRYVIAPVLPDARDREDCLQEAALRIWQRIEQFDPQRGSWNAWVTAVTRNTALDHLRAASRSGGEALTEEIPSPEPTPEEALLRKEQQEHLFMALKGLTPAERMLFYRKYYYRQSTEQIAAELGLTRRAVEGRLYRIRQQLRDKLGGVYHG